MSRDENTHLSSIMGDRYYVENPSIKSSDKIVFAQDKLEVQKQVLTLGNRTGNESKFFKMRPKNNY